MQKGLKTIYDFGLSECNRVKGPYYMQKGLKTVYDFGLSECNSLKLDNCKVKSLIYYGTLNTCNFVCGTMSCTKLSFHWPDTTIR